MSCRWRYRPFHADALIALSLGSISLRALIVHNPGAPTLPSGSWPYTLLMRPSIRI